MLTWAQGTCDSCGESLAKLRVIQSVNVACANCGERQSLCRGCQAAGCPSCGGRLLDAWELAEREFPGQGILF
jgi:hypothetical protein